MEYNIPMHDNFCSCYECLDITLEAGDKIQTTKNGIMLYDLKTKTGHKTALQTTINSPVKRWDDKFIYFENDMFIDNKPENYKIVEGKNILRDTAIIFGEQTHQLAKPAVAVADAAKSAYTEVKKDVSKGLDFGTSIFNNLKWILLAILIVIIVVAAAYSYNSFKKTT